jgi:hypothetical protein
MIDLMGREIRKPVLKLDFTEYGVMGSHSEFGLSGLTLYCWSHYQLLKLSSLSKLRIKLMILIVFKVFTPFFY